MSASETTPVVDTTDNGEATDKDITLAEYLATPDKGKDGSVDDVSLVETLVGEMSSLIGKYQPHAEAIDALITEGCNVCMSLRKHSFRGDGAKDYYGRSV